ncbi:MAG TPA: RDD family protein [Cyclobacteriaceae bacterium]|nr:RDD family protein [Cyclobacteriaceae bacterium]
METIRVRTTQNVYIEYPVASLGDRIVAFLIDAVILTAYNFVGYFIIEDSGFSTGVNILLFVIPFFLYHPVFEILMNGQTPGKKQMRIKVVSVDGSSPTIGAYLMRWLFRLVEVFMLRGALAMITIAANGKGQRLGDIAAGTSVVKLVPQEATRSANVFATAEEGYEPTFPQAAQLNDGDLEVIYQALEVNRDTGNPLPANRLSDKVKSLLGIESDLPPVKFLYTIIKDHNQLVSST